MAGASVYSAYAEGSEAYFAARNRRAAFEANVAKKLENDDVGIGLHRVALMRAIGAAHVRVRHALELRTSFKFGTQRFYVMFQAGASRRRADLFVPNAGPLAERVMGRLEDDMLDSLSVAERQRLAAAIDNSEITRLHPLDIRVKLPLPGLRLYSNLVMGKCVRGEKADSSANRRAPTNETFGFILFMLLVAGITSLGLALIASTMVNLAEIASDADGRDALWNMFASLIGSTATG